ncbi:hypothetical protein [Nocardioides sp. cx-173]|uniref:hypothetical protein n=1 Tax=Nocardioides sp. cx-173 TaxID=2898796 RepID=UPI001E289760|nr:hypothetical protein [Nocardioides sp. cx-173]MCD4523558.1 hypothetical protein [Nocardioides sp. cx-173]UGB42105.1 hypothetical protein LQ940_00920 [Nocardioides sp. cx-173]
MLDLIYVLVTLGVFVLLALLVGVLDRSGASESPPREAGGPAEPRRDLVAEGGAT